MSRLLLTAVLTLSSLAFAQTPDESKVTDAVVATLVTIPGMATFSARKTALTDAATKKLLEKFPKGRFSK